MIGRSTSTFVGATIGAGRGIVVVVAVVDVTALLVAIVWLESNVEDIRSGAAAAAAPTAPAPIIRVFVNSK